MLHLDRGYLMAKKYARKSLYLSGIDQQICRDIIQDKDNIVQNYSDLFRHLIIHYRKQKENHTVNLKQINNKYMILNSLDTVIRIPVDLINWIEKELESNNDITNFSEKFRFFVV